MKSTSPQFVEVRLSGVGAGPGFFKKKKKKLITSAAGTEGTGDTAISSSKDSVG